MLLRHSMRGFLSTPSARRATSWGRCRRCAGRFLSTPSARRATKQPVFSNNRRIISIHALREEGDSGASVGLKSTHNFYPRPPRGGRPTNLAAFADREIFLSTPSARRATVQLPHDVQIRPISIHALREEGDLIDALEALDEGISIHALREEGDIVGAVQTMRG